MIGQQQQVDSDACSHSSSAFKDKDPVWQDPFITVFDPCAENNYNGSWYCQHCNSKFQGLNAVKCKAHLAKQSGFAIKKCRAIQGANKEEDYKRLWNQYLATKRGKRSRKKLADETAQAATDSLVEELTDKSSSRVAKKLRRTNSSSSVISESASSIGTGKRQSSVASFASSSKRRNEPKVFDGSGGVQLDIRNTSNQTPLEAALEMDALIGDFIICGGRPFSMVEDPAFGRIIKAAKKLPADY